MAAAARAQSAVNVEHFLHQRLNSDRIDFEQDERMFLVEVAYVGQFVQQFREDATSC